MVLCKSDKGKVGLRVRAINKGIFVVIVEANSPAAMVRLRFGDQILQINGANVAGYSMDKVHEIFKKAGKNNIRVAVRDRCVIIAVKINLLSMISITCEL